MTRIRIGEDTIEIHDWEWPHWIRAGRVPPDALILSPVWSRGLWKRAERIEAYHLFLPMRQQVPAPGEPLPERHGPFRLFRGRFPAVTEVLVALNVLIATGLFLAWGRDYGSTIWDLAARLRQIFEAGWVVVLLVPLFLHGGTMHVLANMVALLGSGAVVEEFYGRVRTSAIYFMGGITGAVLSYAKDRPVLAIGASGAIFGLYGAAAVFLIRYHRRFPERLRWKAVRVYLPFLVLIVAPSIWQADLLSHAGGFLGGALAGLLIPPLRDRLPSALGPGEHVIEPNGGAEGAALP